VAFPLFLCSIERWSITSHSLVPSWKNRRKNLSGNIAHYSWYSSKFHMFGKELELPIEMLHFFIIAIQKMEVL